MPATKLVKLRDKVLITDKIQLILLFFSYKSLLIPTSLKLQVHLSRIGLHISLRRGRCEASWARVRPVAHFVMGPPPPPSPTNYPGKR